MTKPVRVVLAEDEAIIRLDLKEILEEEDYEVVGETGRGDHAIDLVRELNPDLAILDIKMPGMDGLTAARTIAGERLAAVLILTAFSQHDLVDQARDAGALAYLVKPFQKSDLIPAIEMALGRFEQIVSLEHENADLAERLEARKIIDRAKGRLMDEHSLSEAASWRFLQKAAMDSRRKIHEVARDVVGGTLTSRSPADAGDGDRVARPGIRSADDAETAAARRPFAGVPGVLRAPDRPRDEVGHRHERGLRLHVDAGQGRAPTSSPTTSRSRSTRPAAAPTATSSTPSTRPAARRPPTCSRRSCR